MNRAHASLGVTLSLLVTIAGCSADDGSSSSVTDDSLVGGKEATDEMFMSTVLITGGCTAAKVGPRHLVLAAHCVHDSATNTLRPSYQPNATITFTRSRVEEGAELRTGIVEETYEHPTWQAETPNAFSGVNILGPNAPADLAVIVLTAESATTLDDIPQGTVDTTPIAPGEPVSVLGYGCENGVRNASNPRRRLKFASVAVLAPDALIHEGSFFREGDPRLEPIAGSYIVTPGHLADESAGSLCPGDSGGSVYRGDGASNLIVGINAYYTFDFAKSPEGESVTNLHTRLDAEARNEVATWLEARGVSTKR